MRRAAIFAALLFLAASARGEAGDSPGDIALTWDRGKVVLPSGRAAKRLYDIADVPLDTTPARALPAIVYIHGSDGILNGTIAFAHGLSDGGFAIFMPDSFKRPGRVSNCDPKSRRCGAWPSVYRHRIEEIAYAAQAIARIPFVDSKRVVLLGHSEGGIAAAHYPGDAYAGIVISGWHCGPATRGRDRFLGDFSGIKSPPSVPVLSIYSQRDPWFIGSGGLDGDCSRYFADRAPSRAILEPGDVHYLLGRADMRKAVLEFARNETEERAR